MRYPIVASVLIVTFATACRERAAPSEIHPKSNLSVSIVPWLTSEEVAKISKRVAISNGIALEKYDEPSVTSDISGGKVTWTASFQMTSTARQGAHFMVEVDDVTEKTTYIAGE